jgi:hypothetical protein
MKPFTIRKATQPGKGQPVADASHDASQKYNASATAAGMRGEEEYGSGAEDEHL